MWNALVEYDYGSTADGNDWVSAQLIINGQALRAVRHIGPAMGTLMRPPLEVVKRDLQRDLLRKIDKGYFG